MGFTINSVIAASEKLKRAEVRFLEAVKQGSSSVTKRSTKKIARRGSTKKKITTHSKTNPYNIELCIICQDKRD